MLAAFAFLSAAQTPQLTHFPWWEGEFLKLKREGLLMGYPSSIHDRRLSARAYRYDAAVKVNTATTNALGMGADWLRFIRLVARGEAESDIPAERKGWLRASERLPFLVREFDKELSELGVNIPQLQRDLAGTKRVIFTSPTPKSGEALTRFSDVPHGHWADKAVHNLRREGVIWGYPDGTFQGGPVRATPSVAWREEFEKLATANFFIRPETMTPPMDHNRFTASLQAVSFYKTVEDLIELALSEKRLQAALRSIALDEKGIQTRPSACYRDLATAYHSDLTFLKSESTNFRHLANLILLLAPEIDMNPFAPRTAAEMYIDIEEMLATFRNLRIPEVGEGKGQP